MAKNVWEDGMRYVMTVSLVLSLAACGSSGGGGATAGEFCPQCVGFCGAGCPKDDKGNCKACGKAPVKANECQLSFFWCSGHKVWHAGKPCVDDESKKCCAETKATAMCVARATKGLAKAKYCPACRGFCGAACPLDDKGNCKACGKPPVEADAIERCWFWCNGHNVWHDEVCGDNAAKKCCTEKKIWILACFSD